MSSSHLVIFTSQAEWPYLCSGSFWRSTLQPRQPEPQTGETCPSSSSLLVSMISEQKPSSSFQVLSHKFRGKAYISPTQESHALNMNVLGGSVNGSYSTQVPKAWEKKKAVSLPHPTCFYRLIPSVFAGHWLRTHGQDWEEELVKQKAQP